MKVQPGATRPQGLDIYELIYLCLIAFSRMKVFPFLVSSVKSTLLYAHMKWMVDTN